MKKFKKFPRKNYSFRVNIPLNIIDFENIKNGRMPNVQDYRWMAKYEEPWIYFYRIWVMSCIYKVHVIKISDGYLIDKILINGNEKQYKYVEEHAIDYFEEILKVYIQSLNR